MLYIFSPQRLMNRTLDEIMTYEQQALDLLPMDHPHYEEVRQLLTDQINDQIRDYAYTRPNSGASST